MDKLNEFSEILFKIKFLLFEMTLLALFVVALYRVVKYELGI
jgi:hypothetical protein